MGDSNRNVVRIVIESLKDVTGFSYTKIAQTIGCSEQTLMNWRNGIVPRNASIDAICSNISELFESEEQEQEYLSILKGKFLDAGNKVNITIESYNSVPSIIKYLFNDLISEINSDKIYNLFNDSDNGILKEILERKLQINREKTPIFQIEKLGVREKEILETSEVGWKLNLDHCFIIKFKVAEKKYTYKILINFNFNQNDYEASGDYTEARNAAKAYGVKMILLFGNADVSDKEVNFWVDSNVYMERITSHEINEKEESKDYIYGKQNTDFELEILANKYADLLIGRLRKYFSVIFKNILFDVSHILTIKQKESYIFWEAKYAVRHHINFQETRIKSLMDEKVIYEKGTALAIGYLSFPCILRLANKYDKVYLLDNSNTAVKMYEQYLGEYELELLNKVKFITFTSALFGSITEKYHLYCSLDFILIGTGSGSFIKKLQIYYQICNLWLKKDGVLYISFLNSDFLYEYVDKVTAEENFDFIPDIEEKKATALISNNTEKYDLFCETYECNGLKNLAEKYFNLQKIYSYPLASVLEGAHKNKLQNVLKELDKEYSKNGFLVKTFSNCRGYYIDGVLKKKLGNYIVQKLPENCEMKKIEFKDKKKYKESYLKTLLLAEKSSPKLVGIKKDIAMEVYVVILSTKKMLPETTNKEICIGARKFRLLEISEINTLGIEYKNICPLLKTNSHIRLNCYFDEELIQKSNKIFYIGDGSNDGGYEIKGYKLVKLLKEFDYSPININ